MRAELRDAAVQSCWYSIPILIGLLKLLPYGSAWFGLLVPVGLFFGGQKAQAVVARPRTGAAPGPLRMPDVPLPPTGYETRLCALLAAQDGRRYLWGVLIIGGFLAVGDLLRLPLADEAVSQSFTLLNTSPIVGIVLGGGAAWCGYWLVLGSRYLAARAMVMTDETQSGAIGRR